MACLMLLIPEKFQNAQLMTHALSTMLSPLATSRNEYLRRVSLWESGI